MENGREIEGKSGFDTTRNRKHFQPRGDNCIGQPCPSHCPQADEADVRECSDALGEPLSIAEAARLIGCGVWTIRQRYLRLGIPYFRSRARGKLIFYRNQVVQWLLEQQKGGILR